MFSGFQAVFFENFMELEPSATDRKLLLFGFVDNIMHESPRAWQFLYLPVCMWVSTPLCH